MYLQLLLLMLFAIPGLELKWHREYLLVHHILHSLQVRYFSETRCTDSPFISSPAILVRVLIRFQADILEQHIYCM